MALRMMLSIALLGAVFSTVNAQGELLPQEVAPAAEPIARSVVQPMTQPQMVQQPMVQQPMVMPVQNFAQPPVQGYVQQPQYQVAQQPNQSVYPPGYNPLLGTGLPGAQKPGCNCFPVPQFSAQQPAYDPYSAKNYWNLCPPTTQNCPRQNCAQPRLDYNSFIPRPTSGPFSRR